MTMTGKISSYASLLSVSVFLSVTSPLVYAESCITPPSSCRVTDVFGYRVHPKGAGWKLHKGADYGCPIGTPMLTVENGNVLRADFQDLGGNFVVMQGVTGRQFKYLHLSRHSEAARQLQTVVRGSVIANSGNTGRYTTGPHLHFEAWSGGKPVDPEKLMCRGGKEPPAEKDVGDSSHENPAEEPIAQGEIPQPDLGDGSLFDMIYNMVGAKALNPDYPAQLARMGKERLYSELAYLEAASLRLNAEKRGSLERIEVMNALRQILLVESHLKPELSKAKANAMRK